LSTATAVVFVHGFQATRRKFSKVYTGLDETRSGVDCWPAADLFFFGYECTETTTGAATDQPYRFPLAFDSASPDKPLHTGAFRNRRFAGTVFFGWSRRSSLD